jgi:oligopeptide/dipeptide ABC transporter ATP-binding protein
VEVIRKHKKCSKKEAWRYGVQALHDVSIPDPEKRMDNYPFELSGGMRQRILIAISVACNSKLIIADEPTTALDVTIQAQVMELLQSIVDRNKTSLVIVTHNLGLVTRHAQRIYVMYAGKIIESGTTEELITRPRHPYTKGLLNSVPKLDQSESTQLIPIEGTPPSLVNLPDRCAFLPRCPYACDLCRRSPFPALRGIGGGDHFIACHRDIAEDKS